jgi:hypothetical protein
MMKIFKKYALKIKKFSNIKFNILVKYASFTFYCLLNFDQIIFCFQTFSFICLILCLYFNKRKRKQVVFVRSASTKWGGSPTPLAQSGAEAPLWGKGGAEYPIGVEAVGASAPLSSAPLCGGGVGLRNIY